LKHSTASPGSMPSSGGRTAKRRNRSLQTSASFVRRGKPPPCHGRSIAGRVWRSRRRRTPYDCTGPKRSGRTSWVSTMRPHLEQETRNTCRETRIALVPGSSGRTARRRRRHVQERRAIFLGKIVASGRAAGTLLRNAAAVASFSICFEVGIRHLAGRSFISPKRVARRHAGSMSTGPVPDP
jgi:hypothetical protein